MGETSEFRACELHELVHLSHAVTCDEISLPLFFGYGTTVVCVALLEHAVELFPVFFFEFLTSLLLHFQDKLLDFFPGEGVRIVGV